MAQTVQKGKRRAPDSDDASSPRPAAKRPRSTARKSTGGNPPVAARPAPRASGSGITAAGNVQDEGRKRVWYTCLD